MEDEEEEEEEQEQQQKQRCDQIDPTTNAELAEELARDISRLHAAGLVEDPNCDVLEETVTLLLSQLEEFSALQGMVSEDASLCFDKTLPQIQKKNGRFRSAL